jgi:hypothetical protein
MSSDFSHLVGTTWMVNSSGRTFTVESVEAQYAYVLRDSGQKGRILAAKIKPSKSLSGYALLETPADTDADQPVAAGVRFVGGLGVQWCVLHSGIVEEAEGGRCDMFNKYQMHPLDDDGEPIPCDTRNLVYEESDDA